jgi:hypothetical protein
MFAIAAFFLVEDAADIDHYSLLLPPAEQSGFPDQNPDRGDDYN